MKGRLNIVYCHSFLTQRLSFSKNRYTCRLLSNRSLRDDTLLSFQGARITPECVYKMNLLPATCMCMLAALGGRRYIVLHW